MNLCFGEIIFFFWGLLLFVTYSSFPVCHSRSPVKAITNKLKYVSSVIFMTGKISSHYVLHH